MLVIGNALEATSWPGQGQTSLIPNASDKVANGASIAKAVSVCKTF